MGMGEENWGEGMTQDEFCAWCAEWSGSEDEGQAGTRLEQMTDGAAAEFIGMQIQWPKDKRVAALWPEEADCMRCGSHGRCVTHPQPYPDTGKYDTWRLGCWEREIRSYYEKTKRTITSQDKTAARQLQESMSQKKRKAQVIKEEEAHATSTSSKRVKPYSVVPPAARSMVKSPRPEASEAPSSAARSWLAAAARKRRERP